MTKEHTNNERNSVEKLTKQFSCANQALPKLASTPITTAPPPVYSQLSCFLLLAKNSAILFLKQKWARLNLAKNTASLIALLKLSIVDINLPLLRYRVYLYSH